jgi:FtsH-binding integral membrane protein
MKTEPQGWDRNLRLGKEFWLVLAAIGPVTGFAAWPMLKGMPLFSQIAGFIVLPFLTAVVAYTAIEIIKVQASRRQIKALAVTMVFVFGICAIAYFFGEDTRRFILPGSLSFAAIIIYHKMSEKS